MSGFFTRQETKSAERPDGKLQTCYSCGLYNKCDSPKMKPFGNFKKGIMNIGEAPGLAEDRVGKPFQGRTGQLLERTYAKLDIDLFEDCINLNAVNCCPTDKGGKNRPPTNIELDCCRRIVLNYINQYKPKIIVLLGKSALYSIIGNRWKGGLNSMTEWRGWTIPDQDFECWVCPAFHPSYVERIVDDQPVVKLVWEQDLRNIFNKLKEPFVKYVKPEITFLEDLKVLNGIKNGDTISFDYETTGLKPHADTHRIVCCSVAINEDQVYVFEMPNKIEKAKPFIDVLKNAKIKKMAHHLKFEDNWSWEILGARVRGWSWDSMLAAHILDNRAGITGLKFQTYVNFGIVSYDEAVKPYLQADDKNANSMNTVLELVKKPKGKIQLMEYCAMDSIFEFRLAMKQMKEFELQTLPF